LSSFDYLAGTAYVTIPSRFQAQLQKNCLPTPSASDDRVENAGVLKIVAKFTFLWNKCISQSIWSKEFNNSLEFSARAA